MRQEPELNARPFPHGRDLAGRALKLALIPVTALALAACGGSSSSSSGGGDSGGTDWISASYEDFFDLSAAETYSQTAEFLNVDADCVYYGCGDSEPFAGYQPNPYQLINVHVAHTAGLTGAGTLVAVVDAGFLTSHQEFDGKTLYTYGTPGVSDHGTHVASLIAGNDDGVGMMGVAPDADLHLSSFYVTLPELAAATLDAASMEAVAQNNSWGFTDDYADVNNLVDALTTYPNLTDALSYVSGDSASDWQTYLDALDTFQDTGVIVFAISNNETFEDGSIFASLPYFDESLQDAWISVVNGYYEVDGDYNITDAVRISAACGYAAEFCLAGDGTTWAAEAGSDSDYGYGTGTSYAAPQVSGAVALLAEAFPDLTPEEWTDRLLASADNTWFDDVAGVSVDGTVDFGNGITHGYSDEWGHGVLDIQAALSPIGSLSLLSGDSVVTAARTELSSARLSATTTYGDSLKALFSGQSIAVFDALNGNFTIEGDSLVQNSSSGNLATVTKAAGAPQTTDMAFVPLDAGQSTSFTTSVADDFTSEIGFTTDLSATLSAEGAMNGSSVFSLAEDAMLMSATQELGAMQLQAYGFASTHEDMPDGAIAGAGVKAIFDAGDGNLSLGFTHMSEQGAVLGLQGNEAFDFGDGSAISAMRADFEHPLGDTVSVFGGIEYGFAQATGQSGNSLVSDMSALAFTGFRTGIEMNGLLATSDTLTFAAAQPLRLEAGTATVLIPTGRTTDGTLTYAEQTASLTPSGREFDLSLSYLMPFGQSAQMGLSGEYRLDDGHVAGEQGAALAASVTGAF